VPVSVVVTVVMHVVVPSENVQLAGGCFSTCICPPVASSVAAESAPGVVDDIANDDGMVGEVPLPHDAVASASRQAKMMRHPILN
jgi:hypothetical protein